MSGIVVSLVALVVYVALFALFLVAFACKDAADRWNDPQRHPLSAPDDDR